MRKPLLICLALVAMILVIPAAAYAQSPAPPSAANLTVAMGIVMVLSMLIGIINLIVQSGGVLGIVTTPKAWLPYLAVVGEFLIGVVGYEKALPTPAFDVADVFLAVMAGAAACVSGALPAFVKNAHHDVPKASYERKLAAKTAKLDPVTRAAMGLMVALALVVSLVGCLKAQSAAQQAQDLQTAMLCVQRDWGQPIAVIAGDCVNNLIPAAEDLVADVEALIEGQSIVAGLDVAKVQAAFPYAGNANVTALVQSKRAKFLQDHQAAGR